MGNTTLRTGELTPLKGPIIAGVDNAAPLRNGSLAGVILLCQATGIRGQFCATFREYLLLKTELFQGLRSENIHRVGSINWPATALE